MDEEPALVAVERRLKTFPLRGSADA